jgi:hypothetical protein
MHGEPTKAAFCGDFLDIMQMTLDSGSLQQPTPHTAHLNPIPESCATNDTSVLGYQHH